ncbi:hypothetical protein [Dysgonomonas mossii]
MRISLRINFRGLIVNYIIPSTWYRINLMAMPSASKPEPLDTCIVFNG